MEHDEGQTKVQVVYYLSRGGQLQQPHLIDVPVSANGNGIYLRDVKRRLAAIRGKGMGESFSWSCKRNYRTNFIWQDLVDDDKILPLNDGELVLKGSELYVGFQEKTEFMDGQLESENMSQLPSKIKKLTSKKFDFEAVKRSLDLESDKLQEQSDLAAALSLSLQLMSDPHIKRFSKDKSMDLNQQVMNSLSQAKSNPAEECLLDHTDISSETFHSEESTVQKFSFNETVRERNRSTASASSSGTDRDHSYGPPKRTETIGRDRSLPKDSKDRSLPRDVPRDLPREVVREVPRLVHREVPREVPRELSRETPKEIPRIPEVPRETPKDASRDGSKVAKENSKSRQEKPEELPSIKTKRSPTCSESGDSSPFMLSPRRLMAVLANPSPEKKSAKLLNSSSTRSSTPSISASTHCDDSLPHINIRFSKQATCLANFRLCGSAHHHATDSRPDSPEHPLSLPVQPGAGLISLSPNSRGHQGGPYWPRWRSGRKPRPCETKEIEPGTPTKVNLSVDKTESPISKKSSFEFVNDRSMSAADKSAEVAGDATEIHFPQAETDSHSPIDFTTPDSRGVSKVSASLESVYTSMGVNGSAAMPSSNLDAHSTISVKEVITQQSQSHPIPESAHNVNIDTASLPRVSISDMISEVRENVKSTSRPDSPESPMKPNPPSSPVRTSVHLSSSPSFNKRIEDARVRARNLVSKEIRSGESRSTKEVTKENDRAKSTPSPLRTPSTRTSSNKNGTTGAGSKSLSGTFNRSPPRLNSMLWEDAPLTPTKKEFVNRDDRPLTAGRTNLDWEKTLQEAGSLSLPPPDFGQILQECGQCGRTFKPDSLKVHMRGCHTLRRSRDLQSFNGTPLAMRTRLQ